jgi:hypothetical protein
MQHEAEQPQYEADPPADLYNDGLSYYLGASWSVPGLPCLRRAIYNVGSNLYKPLPGHWPDWKVDRFLEQFNALGPAELDALDRAQPGLSAKLAQVSRFRQDELAQQREGGARPLTAPPLSAVKAHALKRTATHPRPLTHQARRNT